jgi:hypothetical protein
VSAESWQKENFSVAYVAALANLGKWTIGTWNTDIDGVDITIRKGALSVDLQLKCTQNPVVAGEDYVYNLDVKTYDKLRDNVRSSPSYLVLVKVPEDIGEWIEHSDIQLLMRCSGYYAAMIDRGPAPGRGTIAIHLPSSQLFCLAALDSMYEDARKRAMYGSSAGAVA